MVFRFCPQCGKEPLAHNAMREGEYSCPDCKGEFFIDLLSAFLGGDASSESLLDKACRELSPSDALHAATVELEEVADFELTADDGHNTSPHDVAVAMEAERKCVHNSSPADGGRANDASLRDWFAGQVLSGQCYDSNEYDFRTDAPGVSRTAYAMADAMLAARVKGKEARRV